MKKVIGIAPAEPEIYSKERLHEILTVRFIEPKDNAFAAITQIRFDELFQLCCASFTDALYF